MMKNAYRILVRKPERNYTEDPRIWVAKTTLVTGRGDPWGFEM
jgi:hypothetical protein